MKNKRFETWRRDGASNFEAGFLRHNARLWTTDKDRMIIELLATEITARTIKKPGRALPVADRRIRRVLLHRCAADNRK